MTATAERLAAAREQAYALPLAESIVHATRDAAWASRSEHSHGRLAIGLHADFIVLDRDIFERPVEELLETTVLRTVVGGRTVHRATADGLDDPNR